jgi:hypothetical protein
MATSDAIAAITDAVRALLDGAVRDSTKFAGTAVSIYQSVDLQRPLSRDTSPAVSVLLHRVSISPARRNVPLRTGQHGERYRPPIPLDLYYLVTAWSGDPRMQHGLLGWAVRTIEDNLILPSALLNDNGWDGTFAIDESVELTWAPLTPQEEFDLWQIAQTNQQPSASYVARTVAIESRLTLDQYAAVQTTQFDHSTGVVP